MRNSHFIALLSVVLCLVGLRVAYYYLRDNENVQRFIAPLPDNVNKTSGRIVESVVVVDAVFVPTVAPPKVEPPKTAPPKAVAPKVAVPNVVVPVSDAPLVIPKQLPPKKPSLKELGPCNDTLWCNIPLPKVSYFRFAPPTDEYKWRRAQIQAMKGEQVLLKRIVNYFPNYLDFLDGDSSFRKYNYPIDVFIDKKRDLSFLKQPLSPPVPTAPARRLGAEFSWEREGKMVIPANYDYTSLNRAPVVKLGYFAFAKVGGSNHFEGPQVGEAALGLREFLKQWKAVKDEIKTPWIAVHSANENWGLLSTYYPNRTIDWGKCCHGQERADLLDFLNHNKTLAFFIGQHANFTHPKLVTFPRGIPLPNTHVNRMMWDTQHLLLHNHPKNQLLFSASSNWGPRPQILKCVSAKFDPKDFQGASFGDNRKGRIEPKEYYRRLGMSRTGLSLSGLGADCFRLWEALCLGTVPVLEKGFGLDKTLWRLPALLVEDFDLVTPELLRTAYVEALYHADDFQFEKLTQSFWWSFIGNISRTMSTQTVWDRFPPEADDREFTRPFEPYSCWETNSCGPGTMRIPKTSC